MSKAMDLFRQVDELDVPEDDDENGSQSNRTKKSKKKQKDRIKTILVNDEAVLSARDIRGPQEPTESQHLEPKVERPADLQKMFTPRNKLGKGNSLRQSHN